MITGDASNPGPARTRARERRARILELLNDQGTLTVEQLSSQFGCSRATIRRDLASIVARNGGARRLHGAVALHSAVLEHRFQDKVSTCQREKEAIARTAVAHLPNGITVGLNGGTTTTLVAREIAQRRRDITVVTNAINIAYDLTAPGVSVVVVGGALRPLNYETTGPLALTMLDELHLDWAILGTSGVHPVIGATTATESEAAVGRAFATKADHVMVVADRTKFGRASLFRMVDWRNVEAVCTDQETTATLREWERGGRLSFTADDDSSEAPLWEVSSR